MTADFSIAGIRYRASKLDAISQFHVVRRLAPVLGSLQNADLSGAMSGTEDGLTSILVPLSNAVAAMTDADTEYVLSTCLNVCQREQPGGLGWSPVWNAAAKRPQYDDINLPALLQIVAQVLRSSVGDFTAALPRTTPPAVAR